ncbi:type III effector protein [Collimonas silvisoli]|uniref:type III effector protein n=1 Tax=Collimonas silvisoli TaxID=2825884 RepID=UPI001B8C7621|nr:type III effector protein [Collimonas silvisoli]
MLKHIFGACIAPKTSDDAEIEVSASRTEGAANRARPVKSPALRGLPSGSPKRAGKAHARPRTGHVAAASGSKNMVPANGFKRENQPPAILNELDWIQVLQKELMGNSEIDATGRIPIPATKAHVAIAPAIVGLLVDGRGQEVSPTRTDGVFDRYLSREQAYQLAPADAGPLASVQHHLWHPSPQPLEPCVVTIDAPTARRLATARATIDLVKALVPFGAGNQVKDVARTGGESYVRTALAERAGSAARRNRASGEAHLPMARAALKWQAGFCDHQAALAYAVLGSHPDLKDAQIDCVANTRLKHTLVVIRGEQPEHDIVVDPWTIFSVPGLVAHAAADLGRIGLRPEVEPKNKIMYSKPAGTQLPQIELEKPEYQRDARNPFTVYREEIYFSTPEKMMYGSLTDTSSTAAMFDATYNGNPNVRYELDDGKDKVMLRLDVQRAAKPRQ